MSFRIPSTRNSSVPRALLWLPALVLGLLLLTACEVRVDVDIDVDDDGGGLVTVLVALDEDAVANGPEDLSAVLRTGDLTTTGWAIDGPTEDDGKATIAAKKRFADADQLQQVLDEITGPGGMFEDFRLERNSEFALDEYRLTGSINLGDGVDLFNDPATTLLLSGNPLGKPVEEYLDGLSFDDAVPVTVRVSLPGEGDEGSRSNATFQPRFDDEQPTAIALTTVDDDFIARLLRWVGFAALGLFILATVLGMLGFFLEYQARRRGPKVRAPEPMAARVPVAAGAQGGGLRAQPVTPRPAPGYSGRTAAPQPNRQLRVVILDPLGVLYELPDDPALMAVATVRRHGSSAGVDEILGHHQQLILGRISTEEFWNECGVYEDTDVLNLDHISQFRPRAGAAEFLREMRRRQMPVTALSNDATEWSQLLRERDNLAMVEPWLVSGEIGACKPDPGLYEAMRRTLGAPYEGCLFIDTVADHLDAGKTLGMQTAYMTTGRPSESDRPNHPVINSFSDFFRRR